MLLRKIKPALKLPYQNLWRFLSLLLLALLSVFFWAGALFANVAGLFVPADVVTIVRITLTVVSVLLNVFFIGYFGSVMKRASEGEFILPLLRFKNLVRGLHMGVVLFIYSFIFQLTRYMYGGLGVFLSTLVLVVLAVTLPAIMTHVAVREYKLRGFRWDRIIQTIQLKEYWTAYLAAIVILPIYSIMNLIVSTVLQFPRMMELPVVVDYALSGVTFVVYVTFLLILFLTWSALFGQAIPVHHKRKKKR